MEVDIKPEPVSDEVFEVPKTEPELIEEKPVKEEEPKFDKYERTFITFENDRIFHKIFKKRKAVLREKPRCAITRFAACLKIVNSFFVYFNF